jgi:hypothetical protein
VISVLGAGLLAAPRPAAAEWGIYYGYIVNHKDAPIDIIKAEVYEESSGSGIANYYQHMGITTKNVSGKPIVAIRVRWTLHNAFGEQLDEYSGTATDFSGPYAFFAKRTFGPGQTAVHVWQVINTNSTAEGYTVQLTDVLFADGARWREAPTPPADYAKSGWTCRKVPDNAEDCREPGVVVPPDEMKATEVPDATAPSGVTPMSPIGDPHPK